MKDDQINKNINNPVIVKELECELDRILSAELRKNLSHKSHGKLLTKLYTELKNEELQLNIALRDEINNVK